MTAAFTLLAGCQSFFPLNDEKQVEQSTKEVDQKSEDMKGQPAEELVLEASYFNEIEKVDGMNEIMNADNILALVNKTYALSSTYEPKDLVRPKVKFSFGDEDVEKSYLRKEAAGALEEMFAAAEKDGIHLFAASGYRSYSRQQEVLQNKINRDGKEEAVQVVAIPGQSEHQTGLAMDITSESVQFQLIEQFGKEQEGIWLAEHAHLYGFILRYPKGKEKVTGYQYEPWHFRYVGKQAASMIYENNWTLEEYFQQVKKI